MSDFVFNIAKGRVAELANRVLNNDPTNSAIIAVLLDNSVADATAKDYDTLSAVLGDAGTDEATFTNYARFTIDDAGEGLSVTTDDTNDRVDVDVDDITWSSAGNGTNNDISDLIFGYDNDTGAGTDANIVPLTQHDFVLTTQGTDVSALVTNFFRAS